MMKQIVTNVRIYAKRMDSALQSRCLPAKKGKITVVTFKAGLWKHFLLVALVLMSAFVLTSAALAQSTPEEVATALIAAENGNDAAAATALFADDAVVTLPTGVLDTPEAIAGWQEELAAGNFRLEAVDMAVDGSTVTWSGAISLDRFRGLGIASMAANWSLVIEDGLIKTFDFTFTPEAFVELAAGATAAGVIAAEAANDAEAAAALFAPDAVVTLPTGVLDTPEAILGWQQELAAGHFRIEPTGLHVDGNTVSWKGDIALDTFRGLGIPVMGGIWSLTIEDGLVKTFDFTFTEESFADLTAATS